MNAIQKPMISYRLKLPDNFSIDPILNFHQRDPQQLAERVDTKNLSLYKAWLWFGYPTCISITFDTSYTASITLSTEAPITQSMLALKATQMLGLMQPIELFEQHYVAHPELAPLIQKYRGLRIPLTATPFEALTWAIIGQQVSIQSAISLRRKFIRLAGKLHHSGLWCYPDAESVASFDLTDLTQIGFSRTKAQTILTVSQLIQSGALSLNQEEEALSIEHIASQLIAIRGIGPWTVNYTLLRGFGWLDGSLHQDAGVQRSLQLFLAPNSPFTLQQTHQWLAQFTPWRALVAAYLWAFLADTPPIEKPKRKVHR